MYCKSCGRAIRDNAKFCAYCGAGTGTGGGRQPGAQPNQRYQPNTQPGQGHQPGFQPDQQPDQSYQPGPQPKQRRKLSPQPHADYPDYAYTGSRGGAGGFSPQDAIYGAGLAGRAAGKAVRGGAHAVKSAMYLKLLGIIAAALVAIVSILYVVFLRSGKPEDTVAKLEEAMNNLDQEQLLECFDSQSQDLYNGALSVGGDLLGMDLSSLAQLANGLGGIMAGTDLVPQVKITVTNTDYTDKNTCMVTVDMTQSYQGQSNTETMQLPMKKVGREWLITMSLADFGY